MLAKFWSEFRRNILKMYKCNTISLFLLPHPTILRMSHLPSPFPNSRYWLDITVSHINYCSKMTDTLTKTPLTIPCSQLACCLSVPSHRGNHPPARPATQPSNAHRASDGSSTILAWQVHPPHLWLGMSWVPSRAIQSQVAVSAQS